MGRYKIHEADGSGKTYHSSREKGAQDKGKKLPPFHIHPQREGIFIPKRQNVQLPRMENKEQQA